MFQHTISCIFIYDESVASKNIQNSTTAAPRVALLAFRLNLLHLCKLWLQMFVKMTFLLFFYEFNLAKLSGGIFFSVMLLRCHSCYHDKRR